MDTVDRHKLGHTPELPDDAVTAACAHFTASFVWVTPELAQRWLKLNKRNRTLHNHIVDDYLDALVAGHWEFTGQSIQFDSDGKLCDGQHRLTAVAMYGRPVLMLVVRGLDPSAQDVIDTGRKRTAADMFTIAQQPNAALLASTSRLILAYQRGKIRTSDTQYFGSTSNPAIRDFVATDPHIFWAVDLASRLNTDIPANPSAIAMTAWLFGQLDRQAATNYFSALAEMRTNGVGDPRYTLLKRLNAAKARGERLTSVQQAFYIVRAWNAWRTGSALKTIKASTSAGPSPFPDPV